MSPLDDELRRALSDRAVRVQPAADPLVGIEQLAKRIRRNRLASVAASVAMFAGAAAVAVPALLDSTGSSSSQEQIATPPTTSRSSRSAPTGGRSRSRPPGTSPGTPAGSGARCWIWASRRATASS